MRRQSGKRGSGAWSKKDRRIFGASPDLPRRQRHHGGPPAHILAKQTHDVQRRATRLDVPAAERLPAKVSLWRPRVAPAVAFRTSLPPRATAPRRVLPQLARRRASTAATWTTGIAAAALILPAGLMALVLSRAPSSVPGTQPSRPIVTFDLRPLPSAEIDRRLAAMMPAPRLPTMAPAVPQGRIEFAALQLPRTPPDVPRPVGSIELTALALPTRPPDVPAIVPVPVVVPPLSIALRSDLPDDLRPPRVGPLPHVALALPPRIVPPPSADVAQCVAAEPTVRAPVTTVRAVDVVTTIVAAATAQTREFVIYQARYQRIAYPGGDVPSFYGVCTDVIIRAYRAAGIDLQVEVQKARVGRGDPSIDHRRTETLRLFFARMGETLPITDFAEDFQAGDIVTYYRPQNRSSTAHIAIVSDVLAPSGRPMIIHNRGHGVQMEDALFVDKITGHYRYRGPATVQPPDLIASARPRQSPVATRLALRAQSLPGRAPTQAP